MQAVRTMSSDHDLALLTHVPQLRIGWRQATEGCRPYFLSISLRRGLFGLYSRLSWDSVGSGILSFAADHQFPRGYTTEDVDRRAGVPSHCKITPEAEKGNNGLVRCSDEREDQIIA